MPNEDFIPIVVLKQVVLVILKSPDVTNPCQDMVDLSFSLSLTHTVACISMPKNLFFDMLWRIPFGK